MVPALETSGCKNIECGVSLKFALRLPSGRSAPIDRNESPGAHRVRLGLDPLRPTWLGASTHGPEHEYLLRAQLSLEQQAPVSEPPLLILAPRHPSLTAKEICEWWSRHGGLREELTIRSSGDKVSNRTRVYLLDTLGELDQFYPACDVAFIGNSMNSPGGGHNFAEALSFGCRIVHGDNFVDFEGLLEEFFVKYSATDPGHPVVIRCKNDAQALTEAIERQLVAADRTPPDQRIPLIMTMTELHRAAVTGSSRLLVDILQTILQETKKKDAH